MAGENIEIPHELLPPAAVVAVRSGTGPEVLTGFDPAWVTDRLR